MDFNMPPQSPLDNYSASMMLSSSEAINQLQVEKKNLN
jgi:hypothetical protein